MEFLKRKYLLNDKNLQGIGNLKESEKKMCTKKGTF